MQLVETEVPNWHNEFDRVLIGIPITRSSVFDKRANYNNSENVAQFGSSPRGWRLVSSLSILRRWDRRLLLLRRHWC